MAICYSSHSRWKTKAYGIWQLCEESVSGRRSGDCVEFAARPGVVRCELVSGFSETKVPMMLARVVSVVRWALWVFLHFDVLPHWITQALELWMARPPKAARNTCGRNCILPNHSEREAPCGIRTQNPESSDVRVRPTAVAGELRFAFLQCLLKQRASLQRHGRMFAHRRTSQGLHMLGGGGSTSHPFTIISLLVAGLEWEEDSGWTTIKAVALSLEKCTTMYILHTTSSHSPVPQNDP